MPKEKEDIGIVLKDLSETLTSVNSQLKDLDKRLNKIETGGKNDYKLEVKQEDVAKAKEANKDLDPRIVKIVEETLGEDFRVKIESYKDKPGMLFSVIVPQRLSDLPKSSRPVLGENGLTQKDKFNVDITEEYYPEDKRSRAISGTQSYEAIKDHCEKVRAYIVSYYQKMSKPIPEFRLKSY